MLEWAGTVINDGTDRRDRIFAALQPGYFDVDELVFEQLLSMGAEFAAQVKFYNLNNQVEGSWGELFSADEAVVMAMILSTDMKRAEAEFLQLLAGPAVAAASYVLRWARRIDFWFGKLEQYGQGAGEGLSGKLAAIIEQKLAPELHSVAAFISQSEMAESSTAVSDFSTFNFVWGIQRDEGGYLFPRAHAVADGNNNDSVRRLRAAFYAFFNAVSYLKSITPAYLQQSLGGGQHDPATGLYMAFLKLYQRAQQSINRFTQRHLDFYYRQVLQAGPRVALPESAHLLFATPPGMPPTRIEKGRAFSAGKDDQVNDIVYRADTELWLSEVQVASLYTLYLQQDELVAPESELGYTTRIKTSKPSLLNADEPDTKAWPLFGAEKRDAVTRAADDAEVGFSIASPLLRLQEGSRQIELDIVLEDTIKVDADTMTAMLGRCHDSDTFTKLFGRLFSRYLLSHEDWLSRDNKAEIIKIATTLLRRNSANEITNLLLGDWQGLFYKLLKRIFRVRVTTAQGWHELGDCTVVPHSSTDNSSYGLKLCLSLGQEVEPLVSYAADLHAAGLDTEHPVLQCCINPQTHFYPYSLFTDLVIKSIDIDVTVKGVSNLLLYNNHGQLDPSKPFAPFGPMPGNNAYFVFGNYELAQKKLVDLKLNLEWGELPAASGGFTTYYSGYETRYNNDSFKAAFSVLANGRWQPHKADAERFVSLFDSVEESGRLKADKLLQVNVLEYAKPLSAAFSADEYGYDMGSRNGFFKLGLTAPESAFGHDEYPTLLTKVLAENARRKKPGPTPGPPYTPILNKISLDYRAQGRIDPAQHSRAGEGSKAERIYHHHPFGVETVYPADAETMPSLLPQYDYQGNLFIGLSAAGLSGSVTLLFHLSEDHAREVAADGAQFSWFYLSGEKWKRLPATRVLADTTNGFLSSGIVTFDIPADIEHSKRIMPAGLFWLRVAAKQGVKQVCSCYSVHTNALQVTRDAEADQQAVAATIKWQPMAAIAGIGEITQVGDAFGGKAQEDEQAFKTRLSERLRHKNRAVQAWDYERMVLERFPDVAKVKCFANMVSSSRAPAPGHVLVVVVPKTAQNLRPNARAMISALELSRIRAFLQGHASPFVKLEVRNPAFEQIQVRCTVKFRGGLGDAAWSKRLDRDISEYLSPWRSSGYRARFGWSIRQKDMESFIRERDYVDFVTNFSMLHITAEGAGRYRLGDTAGEEYSSEMQIRPRYPWSLALPASHHFIETTTTSLPIEAQVTGVDELEIGNTFIISGNSEYGEEE